MTTALTPAVGAADSGPRHGRPTVIDRPLLCDVFAPALLVIYFVVTWRPLELFIQFPGFASSGVFPVLCVGLLLITPTERLARIPIPWALAAFMGWMALTYMWSIVPMATLFFIRAEVPGVLLLSAITATIPVERLVRVLMVMFCALGVLCLLACIAIPDARQGVTVENGVPTMSLGFRGGFGHKNLLGMFAVFALCLVLPFLRSRWRFPAIAMFVVLILGTTSATAASGLFSVGFAWFWMAAIQKQSNPYSRRLLGLLSIASAIVAALLIVGALPSLLDLYQKDVTFSGRTFIWEESLATVGQRPLHGFGYGAVWADGRNPITQDLWGRIGFPAAHAHNGAIELMLQGGLVALGLVLLFLGRIVRLGGSLLGRPDLAPYGQWGLLTLISLLLMQISEPLLAGGPLGMLVVVWTVLTRIRNDERRRATGDHRWVTTL